MPQKLGIEQILMERPDYSLDPWYMSEFSDTESDDSTLEPIDEQEIYGESMQLLSCLFLLCHVSYAIFDAIVGLAGQTISLHLL